MSTKAFIDKVATKIAAMTPADLLHDGKPDQLVVALARKLPLSELAAELKEIIGADATRKFLADTPNSDLPLDLNFVGYLCGLLPRNCVVSRTGVTFDATSALQQLDEYAECIRSGNAKYTVSLRLSGIDIDEDIELGGGLFLRKIAPELLEQKYPILEGLWPMALSERTASLESRVEAVAIREGKASEVMPGSDFLDPLADLLHHAFVIANIPKLTMRVSHINVYSPIENHSLFHSLPVTSRPTKLTLENITALKRAYQLICGTDRDRVLQTSVDRYLLARKQSLHHPNESNRPHWDKIVDYVIAMESIFLTIDGMPAAQELSYRFSLNGAAVLCKVDSRKPLDLIDALKIVYHMRSKVVHGSDDKSVTKAAGNFLELMRITFDRDDPIGCLSKICRQLEDWIRSLFYKFQDMDLSERPYRKRHGWEELIFAIGDSSAPPAGSRLPAG